jgi:hypothetical protein
VGIRLSDDELWAELERAHTGIYTTLRRDGWPISLPTWFVALDRQLYISTPGRSKKVVRIAYNRRGSFLVERGERWSELCAVMLPVSAEVLEAGEEHDAATAAISRKYRDHRTRVSAMPRATKQAYDGSVLIKLQPAGPALTWDNARIRLLAPDRRE